MWGACWWPHWAQERRGQCLAIHAVSQGGHIRLPRHFSPCPTLSHFCSRMLFHAHSLKFSNCALSTLEKSFGPIKMSQMSKVEESRVSRWPSPLVCRWQQTFFPPTTKPLHYDRGSSPRLGSLQWNASIHMRLLLFKCITLITKKLFGWIPCYGILKTLPFLQVWTLIWR